MDIGAWLEQGGQLTVTVVGEPVDPTEPRPALCDDCLERLATWQRRQRSVGRWASQRPAYASAQKRARIRRAARTTS